MNTDLQQPTPITSKPYLVAIERRDGSLGRWRNVYFVGNAQAAVVHVLQTLRDGAMKRIARNRPTLKAFVEVPGSPRHENGKPLVVHGFTLQIGGEA